MFKKRISDAFDELVKQQVTPWAFLTAGPAFRIKKFNGREIHYEGVAFDGSPRQVFWSRYIEPFLENICVTEINAAVSTAKERGVDGRLLLREVQELLSVSCLEVYNRMADIDRRLRGKGFPDDVPPRSIEREVHSMNQFIDDHIKSELAMWKPEPRLEKWFARNKFWAWAIGTIIALAAFVAGLFKLG